MSTHARDGFTTVWHAVEWAAGAALALAIAAVIICLCYLAVATVERRLIDATRTLRVRRTARRSGRTPGA